MPVIRLQSPFSLSALLLFPLLGGTALAEKDGDLRKHPGYALYQQHCLECHGAKGEGVSGKYEEGLHGTRTLESLAKRIDRTMPEDNEEILDAEQSAQVAAYIYDAFYSADAQARNNPAYRALSRLTVAQYRTSVADLIGRFRPGFDRPPGAERGLRATYSGPSKQHALPPGARQEDKNRQERHRFERLDAQVRIQFGSESPDPEKIEAQHFQVRWDGSIIAPETGIYEFVVRTENGVRLFINDRRKELIDSWVTPGPEIRDEKKSIFLIGGRSYPLTLEMLKYKDKSASVELLWKPPHGVLETIPNRNLSPDRLRDGYVVTTAFPADDRSDGYERGTAISKTWEQATTEAAIATADHVDKCLDELSGSKAGTPERVEKLKDFARRFVEAAFRRPLTDEEKQRYVESQFQKAPNPNLAVKRVVILTLKSPRFLYAELPDGEAPDSWDIASRLALTLWDSIPDARLIRTVAEGKLKTRDQIAAEARRMLTDPRAHAKLRGFFHEWLQLEHAERIGKDPKVFPEFSERVVADLRTSLWMFLDQVVWSEKSDYRELLNANYVWMNENLAKLYGETTQGSEFQRVAFDPKERQGVITHPYMLASLAHTKYTSPIHRGVFLTRNIVGMTLKSPPAAIAFEDNHFDPKMTMREKVTSMTKDNACMACHSVINPLGFSLEGFDAIGRWRTEDNKKPIDTTGEFDTEDGKVVKVKSAWDVAQYATTSNAGHQAFIRHLFHHMVKQPAASYGQDTPDLLRGKFTAGEYNIQKLLTEIAVVSATAGMPEEAPAKMVQK